MCLDLLSEEATCGSIPAKSVMHIGLVVITIF